ncbi:MAG: carboxypeptidase-like regulatory domain-containing protein [Acidobacteriota bacterium]
MYRSKRTLRALWLAFMTLGAGMVADAADAQITTGAVFGTVKDAQGAAVPGATVILISETRGTKSAPMVTNTAGEFSLPNITADTYTVEVAMDGFKTAARKGVPVSGGDRVAVPAVVLEVGGRAEVVNVTAEVALIQAQSGERSAVVEPAQIQNLPISGRNFTAVLANIPGITGTTRLGGGGQNNIMMDGISAMDTGNNGQMLQMNMDAIQEVKVLTQGYQAEYGRSSGLQISAVTKGGSNRFHGSFYEIRTDSTWNEVSWANQKNGTAPGVSKNDTLGYTIGGPIGRPGGNNKLFFFYSHEYRPTTSGGGVRRFTLPTALEMSGDFSQSVDNQGKPIPQLYDATRGAKTGCTGTVAAPGVSTTCFPGNKIPANRMYSTGLTVLNMWKAASGFAPNGISGQGYNYEGNDPITKNLTQQPAIRADYQFNASLRVTGKYAGQRQTVQVSPGSIPGFNDTFQKYPFIHNFSTTLNYTITPTTFFEGTWGMIVNYLGAPPITQYSNRNNLGLGNFPLIFPDAGYMDPRYYERNVLVGTSTPFFDQNTNMMSLPPTFSWGSLVGNAPPNISYPGFLNINRTNDVSLSLSKVMGRHTAKAGFYLNHSYKAQNTGAGGGSSAGFQGVVNFGQDSNNPLDTGFGYANAMLGIFSSYTQSSRFVEGSFLYNNVDWYLQDNWRVNNRLTLDYGLRFVHQQPQYDQYQQSSNFFLDRWSLAAAPQLYVTGCAVAQAPGTACPSASRQAKNPITGKLLGANTTAAIGTIVPNSGDLSNGIRKAGDGISKYNYVWPNIVYAPRVGAAYDLTGNQRMVIRGSYGLFFDRPDGNSVFSQVGNPPFTQNPILRYSRLQDVGSGSGLTTDAPQSMVVFQYKNPIQKSSQWNTGIQMALPWASSLDVSYVGQHSFDRLQTVNINSVDLGSAFLPQNQDPTLASATPGGAAYATELMRPYRGLNAISQNTGFAWNTYHSIQSSFNRRFQRGLSFGLNYTYQISNVQNIGKRLEHLADGTFRERADQAQAQALLGDQGVTPHLVRANFVWDLPDYKRDGTANKVVGAVINDWQLSGILTASSGAAYEAGFSYNSNGANVNLTGSPDFGARPILVTPNALGAGCTKDQYSQFNNSVASVGGGLVSTAYRAPTGPATLPAAFANYYGVTSDGPSVGLESGVNYLRGCASSIMDVTLQRNFRLGGGRTVSVRLDAFNVFNTVVFNGRQSSLSLNSPTTPTMRTAQFLADGSVDPTRVKPQDAGFGAVTGASTLRNFQAQVRFTF